MRNLIWSFFERMFPRGASALIMVLLASIVVPEMVGVYALGILALTLFQSLTDAPVRQIAVKAIRSDGGLDFLNRYRIKVAFLGTGSLIVFLLLIYFWQPVQLRPHVWALTPILGVPIFAAYRVKAVARLQYDNEWKALARGQVIAAVCSLLVSIPVLFLTRSIWASSFQLLLTEAVFAVLIMRRAKGLSNVTLRDDADDVRTMVGEYRHLSLYSGLGWGQSQADRVLLAFFAGPAALGLYTFAQSLSRSVGDSLSTSTANVLRPALLRDEITILDIRSKTAPILRRACHMSGLCTLVVILVSYLALPLWLPDDWTPALRATGIMALAVGPTMLAWSITVVLIAMGRVRWAAPIKLIGVLMALPIALVAVFDIQGAALLVVVRDVILALAMILVCRGAIDRKTILLFVIWFIGLSTSTFLLMNF